MQIKTDAMGAGMSLPLELKFLAETGTFEGYASVFGITDNAGDVVAPGAFGESLKRWRAEGRFPPMLWQHDATYPIGVWEEMREDARGLFVKGRLFVADVVKAREAYRLLKEKVVTGLSIGYRATDSRRDTKSGARVLTVVELIEVSMVTFPANDLARVARVKSAFDEGRIPSPREFEAFLREAGFSRKQARGVTALGWKALLPCDAAIRDDDLTGLKALTDTLWRLAEA